jgi:hypothetical protein
MAFTSGQGFASTYLLINRSSGARCPVGRARHHNAAKSNRPPYEPETLSASALESKSEYFRSKKELLLKKTQE